MYKLAYMYKLEFYYTDAFLCVWWLGAVGSCVFNMTED